MKFPDGRYHQPQRIRESHPNSCVTSVEQNVDNTRRNFANELCFQFQDQAAAPKDLLISRGQDSEDDAKKEWNITKSLISDASSGYIELPSLTKKIKANQGRYLLRNIGWRFTSRDEDEALCLTTLLGHDFRKLQGSQCAQRDRMTE
jgi:hypothetical protein